MDFFDNAVSKAKEAFDIACKKTGEFANTQKQKFDVVAIENKRDKDFANLGKIYYETIKDARIDDQQIKNLVEEIKAKNEKIKELRDEISAAKAKRFCPVCAAAIEENAIFCSNCGTKLTFGESDE